MINIFESDIFSLTSLTAAINDVEYQPNQIGAMGIFDASGVTTTSVSIEKNGDKLDLVENKPRGAGGTVVGAKKRTMVSFETAHLPATATVLADEVQNIRAFGTEDTTEAVQTVVNQRLANMARRLDMTHEYHRLGAIQGKVLDSDGSTVIHNLYQQFGVTQKTIGMKLSTDSTDVQAMCLEVLEATEDALGGLSFDGITVLCGKAFWRAFIAHPKVKEAYERWEQGAQLRADPRAGFYFGGINWARYRGGGKVKIADDEAYSVPTGVMDLFISRFAPADYMDTVNTLGLPFYASSDPLPHNKGVSLEAQSNPAHLCTRPKAVMMLKVGTS